MQIVFLMRRVILFAISICALLVVSVTNADTLDTQLQNTIQQYLSQYKNIYHLSAIQLSILLPDSTTPRDYVVGTQEFGEQKLATTTMMTQWGSITKEYTNMLIFKLANDGKFKVTDNLGKIFPEHFVKNAKDNWPTSWKKVTLIQLMNMTSGIPAYAPTVTDNSILQIKQNSMENLVNIAKTETYHCVFSQGCFPVGSAYFYSNTNYIILGLIVEKYTGESFGNVINHTILEPFKQKNSSAHVYYITQNLPKEILDNMIHGYFNNKIGIAPHLPKTWVDVTNFNLSYIASAGALIGDMDTLVKLTDAFYHNQLIAPASELEQNAVLPSNGKIVTNVKKQCIKNGGCYAMGVRILYVHHDGVIFYYQGGLLGYNAIYFWIPSEKVIIAISQPKMETNIFPLIHFSLKINTKIRAYLKLQNNKK